MSKHRLEYVKLLTALTDNLTRMNIKKIGILALLIITLPTSICFSDAIKLKSGRIITGKVTEESETSVTVETSGGKIKFSKENIVSLKKDSSENKPAPSLVAAQNTSPSISNSVSQFSQYVISKIGTASSFYKQTGDLVIFRNGDNYLEFKKMKDFDGDYRVYTVIKVRPGNHELNHIIAYALLGPLAEVHTEWAKTQREVESFKKASKLVLQAADGVIEKKIQSYWETQPGNYLALQIKGVILQLVKFEFKGKPQSTEGGDFDLTRPLLVTEITEIPWGKNQGTDDPITSETKGNPIDPSIIKKALIGKASAEEIKRIKPQLGPELSAKLEFQKRLGWRAYLFYLFAIPGFFYQALIAKIALIILRIEVTYGKALRYTIKIGLAALFVNFLFRHMLAGTFLTPMMLMVPIISIVLIIIFYFIITMKEFQINFLGASALGLAQIVVNMFFGSVVWCVLIVLKRIYQF